MLGVEELEVRSDYAEHEQLHHLGGWAEEGDGPIEPIPGFQGRHYDSVLLDVRVLGISIRLVIEPAQVAQVQRT